MSEEPKPKRRRGWTNRLPTWKRLQDPEAELVKPPPPKVPDISVVICTYNRAELLGGALKTLDNQYYPNTHYEIVVVDDGSTDDTVEVIKSLDLRTDLCYVHQENRGRAAARNVGVAHAKSDLILFVDDDILAPPTLIEEHIRWHTRYRKGIVRGPIKIIQEYALPDRNNVGFLDYSTAMFCTCNASSSKYSIIQAGGFDESFREYGFEDNEMGWRLRLEGYKAHFNNRAVVFHYKPPLRPDQIGEVEQRAEEMARSAMAYYYKHPHWKVALATGLNPLVASWSRIWYSESMYRSCMRQWESGNGSPQGRAKLEHKLFKYFYYRALEKEAHKSGKS